MGDASFNEAVIVVDDEAEIRSLVADSLRQIGIQVFQAADAEEALRILSENLVFLIISDFRMPGMDGIELCRRVREIRPVLPFVLLTGYADKQIAIEGFRDGVSDIFNKPSEVGRIPQVAKEYQDKRKEAIVADEQEMVALREIFAAEAHDLFLDIDKFILALEDRADDNTIVDNLFRRAHTLKGSAGSIPGAEAIGRVVHSYENVLTRLRKNELTVSAELVDLLLRGADVIRNHIEEFAAGQSAESDDSSLIEELQKAASMEGAVNQPKIATVALGGEPPAGGGAVHPAHGDGEEEDSVQITNERILEFMELAGDIIVFKNTLQVFLRQQGSVADSEHVGQTCEDFDQTLEKLADHLQRQVMDLRKIELSRALAKFPRLMRDLSRDLDKKFKFEMTGGKLRVDKTVAKALAASLVHMLRNAADHGTEVAEVRRQKGKPEIGTITLSCFQRGDLIEVTVEDDGPGISRNRVLQKAIANGVISETEGRFLKDEQIMDLIFHPGLSTSEKVSAVSGRGVGMDVVRTEIAHLKGTVRIESEEGRGTRFVVRVPVPKTVMVEESVLVRVGEHLLAIPLVSIQSITSTKDLKLGGVNGLTTGQFLDRTVPVGDYLDFLGQRDRSAKKSASELVVIIAHEGDMVGVFVDEIVEQQDAVIRPFDAVIGEIPGFKGTSVLSSERVAFVVDAEGLVEQAHKGIERREAA